MASKKVFDKLEVFSKKLNAPLSLQPCTDGVFRTDIVSGTSSDNINCAWTDKGWGNSGTWIDKGWSNSGTWIDKGWSNSGTWIDKGWSNNNNWIDSGWGNSGWSDIGGWSNGGGCFITTACVEHMGLPDNCQELDILRLFRDELVKDDPKFREQVLEYYRKAPVVVQKIMDSENKDEVLDYLYHNLILPCVQMLQSGKMEEAKELYTSTYQGLILRYIPDPKK